MEFPCRQRRGACGPGDLPQNALGGQAARGQRRVERVAVGVAGQLRVQWFEAAGGGQEQWQCVAAPARPGGDLGS
jgi:hypothetical protein